MCFWNKQFVVGWFDSIGIACEIKAVSIIDYCTLLNLMTRDKRHNRCVLILSTCVLPPAIEIFITPGACTRV